MLNTWVVLLFLNRIGFAANFDATQVEARVNRMRRKFLELKYYQDKSQLQKLSLSILESEK